MSHTAVYVVVIFVGMYSHRFLPVKRSKRQFIPSIIALAQSLGMNLHLSFSCVIYTDIYYNVTSTFQSNHNLYFATGYFSVLDQM